MRAMLRSETTVAATGLLWLGARRWLAAGAIAVVAFLAIGVPTAVIDNPLFARPIATRAQDYVILAITAALMGLIGATFLRRRGAPSPAEGAEGSAYSGGVLSALAVGCPVCNKPVAFFLGSSGALTYFGPLQIVLGIASVGLLLWTLRIRLRMVAGFCPVARSADRSAYAAATAQTSSSP